jgi:DNA helicase II / ATP-dependent DNA helicase PcrA
MGQMPEIKLTPQLTKARAELNEAQRAAVETIEGPVMVVAGPGTGKTQVLATRIATILEKTDTSPSSILALTFTDSAAKNMRQRLASLIGKPAYYVQIETFHSFCNQVITAHPEYFPIDTDSQLLSDLERFQILEELIDSTELQLLRPINAHYLYVKSLTKLISDLKRENIDPDAFDELVAAEQSNFEQSAEELTKSKKAAAEKRLIKLKDFSLIYRGYQQQLKIKRRYDYDDLVIFTIHVFEQHEDLLLEYQEKILYVLVDEYQDTNSAQNKIIDLLSSYWGEEANVFVVGDPHQSIYRFQGASLENFFHFQDRYTQAQLVNLDQGYRADQRIYDAAFQLMKEDAQLESQLQSSLLATHVSDEEQAVLLSQVPSNTLEAFYVVEKIKLLLADGVPAEEIAILYRHHQDAEDFIEVLSKANIQFEIDGGVNILAMPIVQQWLTLVQLVAGLADGKIDHQLYEVAQYEWTQPSSLSIMKLVHQLGLKRKTVSDFFAQVNSTQNSAALAIDQIAAEELEVLVAWWLKLANWHQLSFTISALGWFDTVLTESGWLEWVEAQPEKIEYLLAMQSLRREIQKMSLGDRPISLRDFINTIHTYREHNLAIFLEDLNLKQAAVHLSTVHKAKGQEWRYVFVVRCIDGKWGNGRAKELLPVPEGVLAHGDTSANAQDQDDRRLLYVAITRAKDQVILSYPETITTGSQTKVTVPSLFIDEIKPFAHDESPELMKQIFDQVTQQIQSLLSPTKRIQLVSDEVAYFKKIIEDFQLSISSLNTYLHSPELFVSSHLLRVPTPPSPILSFGVAMHSVMEFWYSQVLNKGQVPSLSSLLEVLDKALDQQPLDVTEINDRKKYGHQILTQYYQQFSQDSVAPAFIERSFGGGWSKTYLDDIPLKGRIDRIDWVDKSEKLVRVIDYKTGRPKTMGELLGTTQSAELTEREKSLPEGIQSPHQRQLLFYTLLTELDQSFIPKVVAGSFHFLEPEKTSQNFIVRDMNVSPEQVDALKNLIREVMAEIRALAFLDFGS